MAVIVASKVSGRNRQALRTYAKEGRLMRWAKSWAPFGLLGKRERATLTTPKLKFGENETEITVNCKVLDNGVLVCDRLPPGLYDIKNTESMLKVQPDMPEGVDFSCTVDAQGVMSCPPGLKAGTYKIIMQDNLSIGDKHYEGIHIEDTDVVQNPVTSE